PGNSEAILKRHIQLFNIHVEELNEDGTIRYCEACMCIRPDRAHHCSECNTCVLRRDHHCAVMNSCIHQDNTKAYLLHLFYGSLYTSLAFINLFHILFNATASALGVSMTICNLPSKFRFAGSFAYFTCMQLSTWLWIIYVCLIPRNLMLRDKWNRSCPYGNLGWRGNLRRVSSVSLILSSAKPIRESRKAYQEDGLDVHLLCAWQTVPCPNSGMWTAVEALTNRKCNTACVEKNPAFHDTNIILNENVSLLG
uniref:Palmitoyltransferase n=1 Tax=Parascaris equorum TaxID=6256 RepID=A0A914RK23_PAREQ